ncbi:MAG: hypothetical protein M3P18_12160 [Actinomycetota bacterium]|nr:hypothetical protein [Actinomycetota bacterium]
MASTPKGTEWPKAGDADGMNRLLTPVRDSLLAAAVPDEAGAHDSPTALHNCRNEQRWDRTRIGAKRHGDAA